MSVRADGDQSADGDQFADGDNLEDTEDDRSYQACYRFVPRRVEAADPSPPAKRRKTADPSSDSAAAAALFPPLLRGHEHERDAQRRYRHFRECWSEQEGRMARLLQPADRSLLDEVIEFVKIAPTSDCNGRLQTGLVVTGPSAGSQTRLLDQWISLPQERERTAVVQLGSAPNLNLMNALKTVTRTAIAQLDGPDGYKRFVNEQKRMAPMSFDLRLLQEFVTLRDVDECVLYLPDIETFDTGVLVELISVLRAWMDRIPFVLLIGISTTVELFESRLPKATIRCLDCRRFDASMGVDLCGQIFEKLHDQQDSSLPSLGPAASSVLLAMSKEQDVRATGFSRAIKYASMSHFFSNALSVLQQGDPEELDSRREICEAIRGTDSFQLHVEEKLNEGDLETVRALLYDDQALLHDAGEAVASGQKVDFQRHAAVGLFTTLLHAVTPADRRRDSFSMRVEALSGSSFVESAVFTDVMTKIRNMKSDDLRILLNNLQEHKLSADLDIAVHVATMDAISPINSKTPPLYSAYHPSHANKSSTTVTKNHKISLARQRPQLSGQETTYTEVIDDLVNKLTSHLDQRPAFMSESYTYNAKTPLSTIFTPRPRHAIERALSSPHDYLDCDCCRRDGQHGQHASQISANQPATSILWRLWCQAGGIVNVWDLWRAFSGVIMIVGPDDDDDDDDDDDADTKHEYDDDDDDDDENEDNHNQCPTPSTAAGPTLVRERMALALFYRGLAELRLLGFVKPTKRKRDCLAKAAWSGL